MRLDVSDGIPGIALFAVALASAVAADTKEGRLTFQLIAGTYYSTGPMGGSCQLELRPNGRYSEGCFRGVNLATDRGRIELGIRRFALFADDNPGHFKYPEDLDAVDSHGGMAGSTRRSVLPPTWRLVEWGDRRYILNRAQLLDFCIAVAKGSEPRTRRVGSFYLREGDDAKAANGPSPVRECEDPDVRAERRP